MDKLAKAVIAEFKKSFEAESKKPLKVAIFGQTGVGKSSLLNALFHKNLATSAVTPTTKKIDEIPIEGKDKHILFFYDMVVPIVKTKLDQF